jgi:hypothetical protein
MAAHALAEHEPLKVLLTVAHGKVVDELGQDVTQQPTPTSRWIRRSAGVAAAPTPTSAPFATTSGVTPPRTATTIQARWLAATVAASAGSTRHAMCLSSPTRRSRAQRSGSAPIVSLGERRPLLPFRPPPMTPPPLPMPLPQTTSCQTWSGPQLLLFNPPFPSMHFPPPPTTRPAAVPFNHGGC